MPNYLQHFWVEVVVFNQDKFKNVAVILNGNFLAYLLTEKTHAQLEKAERHDLLFIVQFTAVSFVLFTSFTDMYMSQIVLQ